MSLGQDSRRTSWGVIISPGVISLSATKIEAVSPTSFAGLRSSLSTCLTPIAAIRPQPRAKSSSTADLARMSSLANRLSQNGPQAVPEASLYYVHNARSRSGHRSSQAECSPIGPFLRA